MIILHHLCLTKMTKMAPRLHAQITRAKQEEKRAYGSLSLVTAAFHYASLSL